MGKSAMCGLFFFCNFQNNRWGGAGAVADEWKHFKTPKSRVSELNLLSVSIREIKPLW